MTRNEQLASSSGQSGSVKEPIEAEDKTTGKYVCNVGVLSSAKAQPTSTVNPFNLKKGR